MSERGRASGSFLLAISAVVLAIGGYLAWGFLRPDPYALSERVVRDARRGLAYEVREFQRGLEEIVREAKRSGKDVAGSIEDSADKARKGIDGVLEDASESLADLDLELRTQRNRIDRIETRAQEARAMVGQYAEEAKAKAQARVN